MRVAAASSAKSRRAAWRDAFRMVASSPQRFGFLRDGAWLGGGLDRRAGRVDVALHAQPLTPERAHVLDQREQRAALRREHVLDARGYLRVGLACHDSLFLERLQPER